MIFRLIAKIRGFVGMDKREIRFGPDPVIQMLEKLSA